MGNFKFQPVFPGFTTEKELRSTARSKILLVRDGTDHKRYIYRVFSGNGEVYRKLRDVDCPHLPRIYQVEETGEAVHVLEEYIQGDTLAFLLEGGTLSPDQAGKILLQLCQGLKVLHGLGAVHRDIKPENIILRGSEAVLIDFDTSRLRKENTTTDTRIMGTTGYAAPEQYGFTQTDARTDIYSLGILLNEMLTGQHPSQILAKGKFRPIIEKCTRINASQRFHSVRELSAALETAGRPRGWYCLLPAVLVLALLLLPGFLQESLPETQPATESAVESQATEAPSLPLPPAKLAAATGCRVAEEPWSGDEIGQVTDFTCDMDGDGEEEFYRFGICMHNMPFVPHSYFDRCDIPPGSTAQRTPHACVWQIGEDGTMLKALDFAELLTDVELTLYRVDDFDSPAPSLHSQPDIWPGYTLVNFRPTASGTWAYEMTAKFGDLELAASHASIFVLVE